MRWRRALGSGYSGVVVADGHAVTMFSDGETDFLVSLDADSGEENWRTAMAPTYRGREGATDGPVSTPAIAGGAVFALGPRGDLMAVRLDTGELIWRRHLVEDLGVAVPHWGFGTSPLPVGDRLIVETGGDGAVTAFDPSGPGEDHGPDRVVFVAAPIGFAESPPHSAAERIEVLGAVQRDHRHAIFEFEANVRVVHARFFHAMSISRSAG